MLGLLEEEAGTKLRLQRRDEYRLLIGEDGTKQRWPDMGKQNKGARDAPYAEYETSSKSFVLLLLHCR